MARVGRKSKHGIDALGIIEKAYNVDATSDEWLQEVSQGVYSQLGQGLGMAAHYYRLTDDGRLEMGHELTLDMRAPPPFPMRDALQALPPDFVQKSFARCECTTQSAALDDSMREQLGPMLEAAADMLGWRDVLMVGGMDPTGHGVYLGVWLPKETRLAPRVRATWSRVAVHLAAGYRLRRKLLDAPADSGSSGGAEAVMSPNGRIEHAEGDAKMTEAREALRTAVRGMEVARGRLRDEEPHTAVEVWRGLVSCRWSLVDHIESDGKRYILARRNEASVTGLDSLTARERQSVSYAALNHSNKLIAYEMGVSASTVGVLLHRAAKKLGVRSRNALVEVFVAQRRTDA